MRQDIRESRLFILRYRNQLRALLLSLALLPATHGRVHAHPYLPLAEGPAKVFSYRFHVENATMVPRPQEVRGEISMRNDDFEVKNGKRYRRQTTTYKRIPYMTAPQHSWRREEDGNVYLAWMQNGKWIETLELPKDVSLGRVWEYFDGEKSRRTISRIFDLKLASGEVIADCIEVKRTILSNKQLKSAIDRSTYCRDLGVAGSFFQQPTPVGTYTTETLLKSYRYP